MGLGLAHLKTPLRASHLKGNKNSLRRTAPFSVRFLLLKAAPPLPKERARRVVYPKFLKTLAIFLKRCYNTIVNIVGEKGAFPFCHKEMHTKKAYIGFALYSFQPKTMVFKSGKCRQNFKDSAFDGRYR